MTSNQTLNVIHARAAGLDVHKTQITATVLMALPGSKPRSTTRTFSALPSGLRALVGWLADQEVTAAVLEATGIYWEAPYEALEKAGIEPIRVLYAVLKTGKPYRDPRIDYEAIMVQRNAPRWITMLQKHDIDPLTGLPLGKPAA